MTSIYALYNPYMPQTIVNYHPDHICPYMGYTCPCMGVNYRGSVGRGKELSLKGYNRINTQNNPKTIKNIIRIFVKLIKW